MVNPQAKKAALLTMRRSDTEPPPNPIQREDNADIKEMTTSLNNAVDEIRISNITLKKLAENLGKSPVKEKDEPAEEESIDSGSLKSFGKGFLEFFGANFESVKTKQNIVADKDIRPDTVEQKADQTNTTSSILPEGIKDAAALNSDLLNDVIKELSSIKDVLITTDNRQKEIVNKTLDTESNRNTKAEERELLAEAIANRLEGVLSNITNNNIIPSVDIPDVDRRPPTGGPPTGGAPGKTPPKTSRVPKVLGSGMLGKVLLGLGAISAAYEISDIETQKQEKKISEDEANKKSAGVVGGFAGAGAGAAVGAGFGAAFGGVGAIPGALIGGLIGGFLGKEGSEAIANTIINSNKETNQNINPAYTNTMGHEIEAITKMQQDLEMSRTSGIGQQIASSVNNVITNNQTSVITPLATPINTEPSFVNLQYRKTSLLV